MVKVNGEVFGQGKFHNSETIFMNTELSEDTNCVSIAYEGDEDIFVALMAAEYIKDKAPMSKVVLEMLYAPYSRMDREIPEGNQLFSLKYFGEIINRAGFDKVVVLDPHSSETLRQINDVEEADLEGYVKQVIDDFKPDYIFYPDKGAYSKYPEVLKGIDIPYFYGTKIRDLGHCGRILMDEYELHDAPDLNDKSVLIIDDIVALGGTAYAAGMALKQAGAKEVALYISHAENGIFMGRLLDDAGADETGFGKPVDKVYTAGTIPLVRNHPDLHLITM